MNMFKKGLAGLVAGLCMAGAAAAFPTSMITIIVPYPAGSTPDNLARTIAEKMHNELGQSVIVDNRPGASTFIGMRALLRAQPDGHTIAMTSLSTAVLNKLVFTSMPYDPERDFAPLANLGGAPFVLVVNPELGVKSVKELVDRARKEPGSINFASGGIGNSTHLLGEKLNAASGGNMTHVPFAGSAPALANLLGGHVQLYFDSANNAVPHIKAGKLVALAVTSDARMSVLPDVPTMAESGFPDFEMDAWFAISAPRQTPPEALNVLSKAVNAALSDEALRAQFAATGLILGKPGTPDEIKRFFAQEMSKWGEIVKPLNIRLDPN
ncbi:tripartite tricarboxylate transporter substrate binding protein [Alcaligenaceae bacterium]|nr:tripartite tricarboxylate transporter substrate binding protein [Alcaligenaceae bacterium]